MSNEYAFGQSVRLTAAFLNAAGAAADPTTISVKYGPALVNPPPDPTAITLVYLTDAAVIRDSTGNYHADILPAVAGNYVYQWIGTGTVAAVNLPRHFRVVPSPFA